MFMSSRDRCARVAVEDAILVDTLVEVQTASDDSRCVEGAESEYEEPVVS